MAAIFVVYWRVPNHYRNPLVLVGSYVFYGMWDWRFLGLLVLSTVVDFAVGLALGQQDEPRVRKALLATSLVVNLGVLGIFKYANFFVDSMGGLLTRFGLEPNEPLLRIILPVGISFYTFQTLSYTIDVYRRRLEPVRSLIVFATFVAYFPQLVAGPIERARLLLPQLESNDRKLSTERLASGLGLIVQGLFKKVVLADGVAGIADRAFTETESLSSLAIAAGVIAFAIQIYGDFSGYTDIARGVSRLLGIELTVNFAQPYLSRNITEFWRRWHISLSNWLRDYLYIPLGGNRKGAARTEINLMITMLLGGLWHGASWNFVVWGGLHGLFLVIHRQFRSGHVPEHGLRMRDLPAVTLTLALVCGAWIFFRAPDFATSLAVLRGLFIQRGFTSWPDIVLVLVIAAVAVALDLAARQNLFSFRLLTRQPALSGGLVMLGLLGVLVFSGGTPRPFVYFQF